MAVLPFAGAAAHGTLAAGGAHGEVASRGGHVVIPESSIEQPEHIGDRAHTNFKMFVPSAGMAGAQPPLFSREATPQESPPYPGYFFETPASLGCVYKLVSSLVAGCNPNVVVSDPSGGGRAIAIVDAYHYPTAMSDLRVFSAQFGLPLPTPATFQVVYANRRQPPVNADWNIEEALDIQWAHAMAPAAKIYLVEAASSSFADLLTAVSLANSLLKSAGGGEVSMSWGGSEFYWETFYDSYFTQPGVVYFAAAGDSPGVIWPSASPNVVSVGGTSISRNPTTEPSSRKSLGNRGAAAQAFTNPALVTRTGFRLWCRIGGAPRTFPPTPTPPPASGSMLTPIGTLSGAPALPPRFGPASSTPPAASLPRPRVSSRLSMQARETLLTRPTLCTVPAVRMKVT
jgi:hypothetical protein